MNIKFDTSKLALFSRPVKKPQQQEEPSSSDSENQDQIEDFQELQKKGRSNTLISSGNESEYTQGSGVPMLNLSISNSSLDKTDIFYKTAPTQFQQCKKQREQPNTFQIQIGQTIKDGRTTLMIKNIPNKYTQSMLLEKIDIKHKDNYDFFYLPIDFTNKCNVGYAFINFNNVKHIESFYIEFHDKKWNLFNSEKICQITYARIQGVEQLQNHFQYSTIMQEKDKRVKPVFKRQIQSQRMRKY
ncbi:hypothetical protein pb186bvf_011171 [Paramecium bursaria]